MDMQIADVYFNRVTNTSREEIVDCHCDHDDGPVKNKTIELDKVDLKKKLADGMSDTMIISDEGKRNKTISDKMGSLSLSKKTDER